MDGFEAKALQYRCDDKDDSAFALYLLRILKQLQPVLFADIHLDDLDWSTRTIRPPDYLVRIAQTKSPARDWFFLQDNYPWVIPYLIRGIGIPMDIIYEEGYLYRFESTLRLCCL